MFGGLVATQMIDWDSGIEPQGKHSFVNPKDEEADKEDYIHIGRNDQAAVLNVYCLLPM